jgi:hypothetical protein
MRTPAIGCGGPLFVLVRCRSCLQSRQRGVAGTYVVFDMPAICCRPLTRGVTYSEPASAGLYLVSLLPLAGPRAAWA